MTHSSVKRHYNTEALGSTSTIWLRNENGYIYITFEILFKLKKKIKMKSARVLTLNAHAKISGFGMFNYNLGWTCVDVYIVVDIHFHIHFWGESCPVSCKHPLRFKVISSFLSFYSAQPQGQEWILIINSKLAYETQNGSVTLWPPIST